jgi:hypothetical protein
MSQYFATVGKVELDENTAKTLAVILLSVNPASEGMSGLSRLNYARTVLPAIREVSKAYDKEIVTVTEKDGDVSRYAELSANNLVQAFESVISAMVARESFDKLVKHWSEGTKTRGRQSGNGEIAFSIPLPENKAK